MLSDDAFRRLWLELGDPKSWHWKTEQGFFAKKKEFIEAKHVTEILEGLDREHTSGAQDQARAIRTYLVELQQTFPTHGHADAAEAISLLLAKHPEAGFSVPDPEIETYSTSSAENIEFPACVEFAQSQGGVLQSAREAIIYRMHAGKEDFNYYYLTRTVCIYFKQGDSYVVAFDDDPFENILLTNTQEGYEARGLWHVPLTHPFIANAIKRAHHTGRIIPIMNENDRKDPLVIGKCIIGDKTKDYDSFIQQHLKKNLHVWALDNSDVRNIPAGKALCRLLRVGYGVYYSINLNAYGRLDYGGCARSVQKFFSSGNRGIWVPYIGAVIFKQLNLVGADQDMTAVASYFNPIERQLPHAWARNALYSGLGAVREFIRTNDALDAFVQTLVKIVSQAYTELKEDTMRLFEGIPYHKQLLRPNTDVIARLEKLCHLYVIILKRYPKQALTIYEDIKTLMDKKLVQTPNDIEDVEAYLQEFSFLTPERYKQFLALDPVRRLEFIRNHKRKYVAITLGEQTNITIDDYDLIWYAVNSKNLTKDVIIKTLERYGKEAAKLPPPDITPFEIKDLGEVVGYKVTDLRKELGSFLASISTVLLEEHYPYEKILRLLGQQGNDVPAEALALTKLQNAPVNDDVVRLAYGKAYEQLKMKNFLYDIAWILAVKYTADKDFGEDQKRELQNANRLATTDYANPAKTEAETILSVYNRFTELYNDTIKHHFDNEDFLGKIHKPKSQILLIGKELEKIIPIKNKTKIHIRCYPSHNALDLFYGYYGENCTSSYPQELFDDAFVPVRIIQMFDNEPNIVGCIHLYISAYQGKKILAVLGIEPRGDFTNTNDPAKLFVAINEAIEKQAKEHGYDYVCYPENPTMHSNRGQIAKEIAEHIRNRTALPLDFHFPKDHSVYTTKQLYITWKR